MRGTMATVDYTTATLAELEKDFHAGLLAARSAEARAGRVLLEYRKRIEAKGVDWWTWFGQIFTISRTQAAQVMRAAETVEREPITCTSCGKTFVPSRRSDAKTCSARCR